MSGHEELYRSSGDGGRGGQQGRRIPPGERAARREKSVMPNKDNFQQWSRSPGHGQLHCQEASRLRTSATPASPACSAPSGRAQ